MPAQSKLIGLGIIAVGVVASAAVVIVNHANHSPTPVSVSINVPAPPSETVHTADWYVAHPDVLKADDTRCGDDAASIPQAACQNAASADQRILAAQLGQAAAANANAAKSQPPKTP
jgi:hypothetical protein